MKRTVRDPAKYRTGLVVLWALAGGAVLLAVASPPRPFEDALIGVAGVCAALMTLHTLVTRATIEGRTLVLHALRAKHRLRASLDEIVAYRMDKFGRWWIETETRRVRVLVREPWELHRAIVELAPAKLHGSRKRFPGVPPAEEFAGLWTFDVDAFASRAVGTIGGVAIAMLLAHRGNGGGVGILAGLLIGPAIEAWGRLDVTRDGIVRRSPFRRGSIRWDEAQAIFREGWGRSRSFVIVGPECAVEIPAHLAIDRDLIEKVLYSLPDPILCVNFDDTTLRGYRRRKKAKEKAPSEDLFPALTA